MARPLQVLSLLSRLGSLPVKTTSSCRFASRGASGAWMGQSHVRRDRASRYSDEMSEEEFGLEDVEDVEDKLQALDDEGRKRQKTVKYHILRRQMTAPGAPQRKLTWDTIEQIRYLKQEQPEEWTVERLAQGFSVTPDVILRVLRNKFVPSPERKSKQDAKVMAGLGRQMLPSGAGAGKDRLKLPSGAGAGKDRLKLPGNCAPAKLSSGSREGALISAADHTPMIRGEGSGSLATSPAPVTVLPPQVPAGAGRAATVTRSTEEDRTTNTAAAEQDTEEEESWDGQVLTEEELEKFMEMQKAVPPVAQVGNDFFDTEGNFLYRI
ncbi:neugrin [Seriola aureovittata]|uniref:neugrin n=1 Tax=Seriola aureovittata TaxID=2871759 RepID=UPI0024BEA3DB|nr:neugrin [Seriola aureovittata]